MDSVKRETGEKGKHRIGTDAEYREIEEINAGEKEKLG